MDAEAVLGKTSREKRLPSTPTPSDGTRRRIRLWWRQGLADGRRLKLVADTLRVQMRSENG
jgi:hypothetical protein